MHAQQPQRRRQPPQSPLPAWLPGTRQQQRQQRRRRPTGQQGHRRGQPSSGSWRLQRGVACSRPYSRHGRLTLRGRQCARRRRRCRRRGASRAGGVACASEAPASPLILSPAPTPLPFSCLLILSATRPSFSPLPVSPCLLPFPLASNTFGRRVEQWLSFAGAVTQWPAPAAAAGMQLCRNASSS